VRNVNGVEIVSPRLAALSRSLAAGESAALPAFWAEVAARGAPLVEPDPADPTHVWVTFLYRSTAAATVAVQVELDDAGRYPSLMTRLVAGQGDPDRWGSRTGSSTGCCQDHLETALGETDLLFKTYHALPDVRTTYRLAVNGEAQPDPLNPRRQVLPWAEDSFYPTASVSSLLELPAAPPQPWVAPRPGVRRGQVTAQRLHSRVLEDERPLSVYTPPGYAAADGPYDLLVLFDRWAYVDVMPGPTILDNLLDAGVLRPLVAVMVGNTGWAARCAELPCNPAFAEFFAAELVPWIRGQYAVSVDPARTTVGGLSYGGLAAAYLGLLHPELVGNVLSQSGSFQWKPEGAVEFGWLIRQYALRPAVPVRFYLAAGRQENFTDRGDRPSLLLANRHMRDVLQAKGYPLHYAEFAGGHDMLSWQGNLAEGLAALP
jgi:enterochelin esterase-like enzyme